MLMQISQRGLEENPSFSVNFLDDVVVRLVGWTHIKALDRISYRLEGPFWDTWLEHRFFSAGYHQTDSSKRWARGLHDALAENKGLREQLFSPVIRTFPAYWWEPIAQSEPGLSRIEVLYQRHLPDKYAGLGQAIARRNDPNLQKTVQECLAWLDSQSTAA